jgi:hypothetical protein
MVRQAGRFGADLISRLPLCNKPGQGLIQVLRIAAENSFRNGLVLSGGVFFNSNQQGYVIPVLYHYDPDNVDELKSTIYVPSKDFATSTNLDVPDSLFHVCLGEAEWDEKKAKLEARFAGNTLVVDPERTLAEYFHILKDTSDVDKPKHIAAIHLCQFLSSLILRRMVTKDNVKKHFGN